MVSSELKAPQSTILKAHPISKPELKNSQYLYNLKYQDTNTSRWGLFKMGLVGVHCL